MDDMDYDIVKSIEDICFNQNINISRKELHTELLNKISVFLKNKNYLIIPEHHVEYEATIRKTNTIKIKNGRIDILGINPPQFIAIEFDTGLNLKYKSIEKLIQSEANILIGIVKGESNYATYSNLERLASTINEEINYERPNTRFYLIILATKKSFLIYSELNKK